MNRQKLLQQIISFGLVLLFLVGCSNPTLDPPTPIPQTITPTPIPPTSTLPPTPTNTLTPTPDPIVVEAHAFMDPILESIMDRPPNYQDDFSNPYSGWSSGRQPPNGHEEGVVGYENGEYFVMADEAKFTFEGDSSQKITCLSANHSPDVKVLDFVLEVDARFVTLREFGDWQMKFWKESTYYYGVRMTQEELGRVHFHTNFPIQEHLDSTDRLETVRIPSFDLSGGTNHLVIIAKDSQIAMTLNGRVVVYIDNLPPHERGRIGFGVCNFGSVPFRSQWDNLKIWNLSK